MLTRPLLAALTLALALPATAGADTFCVGAADCDGLSKPSLSEALIASDTTAQTDDIVLGPGTYTGPFGNQPGRPVRIRGAGAATKIVPFLPEYAALTLRGPSSVTDVRFEFTGTMSYYEALQLESGARAERVSVRAAAGAHHNTGVLLGDDAALTDSQVAFGSLNKDLGVLGSGEDTTIEDTSVRAQHAVQVWGDAVVRRARLASGTLALGVTGGTTKLESTLLDLRGGGDGIDVSPSGPAIAARLDAAHVTIVGADIAGARALDVYTANQTHDAVAGVRDSIVAGMPGFYRVEASNGRASLALDHVVRDPAAQKLEPQGNGIATRVDASPLTAAPQFVDAGLDAFALVPGSALVDAGSDTPLATGESADVAGRPRIADGTGDCVARRDPGAYEAAGLPCPEPVATPIVPVVEAPVPAPTPAPPAVDRTPPAITGLKVTRAKATFTLSEPAKATLTIQRKRGRSYVTARRIVKPAGAGRSSVALRLRRGRYRVVIEVVDAAGNRAVARRSV